MKVILIIAYAGALRRDEITQMSVDDIQVKQITIFINVPKTKKQSFQIICDRIERLEHLVETLIIDKITHGRGRDSYVMKSDCIPQFSLGDLTMIAQCWVYKLDQLATINQWTVKTTIYHMQSRLAGLSKTWYYHITDYHYSWESFDY
ncbi:hypothetical protein Zmor_027939 [Zophobas morio]|uniref:Uncharacterized protein n=1 Tax=Zophobas morio TaxID=2755281 RepID=A0AA38HRP0_9CUCU|nr:hypothetical protein Zmor_027939 [Zophobas morio]